MDNSNAERAFDNLIRELHAIGKILKEIEKDLREQNIALNERQKNLKGDGQNESVRETF